MVKRDELVGTVLVRCPRCAGVARVVPAPADPGAASVLYRPRNLVCRGCGLSRQHPGTPIVFRGGPGEVADPYFQVPLWLQVETRHGRVWAYNPEHLEMLRQFVRAPLRERGPWYERGRKMSFIARMPAWFKSAKNRGEVLRALDRLRVSLPA
ncbi:hypothetical protein J1792_33705 [Streptomyces triculaminicus]|uniref:TFIIB-type zinc ribbon-containing protein n=2 Tax=Streptomyces TaxID=1883 RepID=A0A939FUA9_9ACTN|nr:MULTISPECIES: hypothetical protein [Streptomyces]MBO0657489.1 hypothetical protein [Streptomyces triculaminicus]QSY52752.1 hypothetical protein J3S04_31420 [Streptomyces griseocarneus]